MTMRNFSHGWLSNQWSSCTFEDISFDGLKEAKRCVLLDLAGFRSSEMFNPESQQPRLPFHPLAMELDDWRLEHYPFKVIVGDYLDELANV